MTKKKIRNLSFIAFVLVLSCCFSSVSNKIIQINYQSWNTNTFSFIENKCSIKINESIKLGEEVVPVKLKGNIYYTIKDYLESKVRARKQLVSYLEKRINVFENIQILESYSRDKGDILVAIDGKESIGFLFLNDTLNLTKSKKIENLETLFNPLKEDEKECFNAFVSIPQHLRIFSQYDVKSKSMTTYQVSMYD